MDIYSDSLGKLISIEEVEDADRSGVTIEDEDDALLGWIEKGWSKDSNW